MPWVSAISPLAALLQHVDVKDIMDKQITIDAILAALPGILDVEGEAHVLTIRDTIGGTFTEIEAVLIAHPNQMADAGFEFVEHGHYVKTAYSHPDMQILMGACDVAGLMDLLAHAAAPGFSHRGPSGNTTYTDSAAGAYQNAASLSSLLRTYASVLDQIAKAAQRQGLQEIMGAAGRAEADFTDVALRMRELGLM